MNGRFLPENITYNTTGSGFLATTDITDSIALDFINANDTRVDGWLEMVDGEILSIAQELDADIQAIVMPLHKKILEFAKCYYCLVNFQDTFGRNDVMQGGDETIMKKLEFYIARCNQLRPQLTKEMFNQNPSDLTARQRAAGTIQIYRA